MKSIVVSLIAFLVLAAAAALFVFVFVLNVPPQELMTSAQREVKFFLYKRDMIDKLSTAETKQFYRNTCTRTCHSSDLIEKKPRTAAEWDWVVKRMAVPERANLSERAATTITQHLQNNYLSNIPTVLPEETMKFVKKHLWKSDFGESDLYLDIIYIPRRHIRLLPYLVAGNEMPDKDGAVFVVYLNTHQGSIPPWDLTEMASLSYGGKDGQQAMDWKIIYEDGQYHHRQGLLLFPRLEEGKAAEMLVNIDLPGVRKRVFQWNLPIPEKME